MDINITLNTNANKFVSPYLFVVLDRSHLKVHSYYCSMYYSKAPSL